GRGQSELDARVQERLRARYIEADSDHPRRPPGGGLDRRRRLAGADAMIRTGHKLQRALVLILLATAARGAPAQMLDAPPPPPTPPPPSNQIDATKLTKLPKVKKFVEAEYPKPALDKGITADVLLLIDINADGKVGAVT